MFAAAHEGLLGELVLILLHCEHRSPLPILSLFQLLPRLILEALLVGDGGGDLLLRLYQLRAHVEDDLIEHLLGLLELGDHRIDVRAEQHRDSIEDIHMRLDGFVLTATERDAFLQSIPPVESD